MTGLTRALGEFLATVSYDALPPETLPLVRDAFTDTAAVALVGASEPIARIVHKQLASQSASTEARLCLSEVRSWGPGAALVTGTAAHALDFDDQSLTGHPSAVLVPAILAEGDALGADGKMMVTAYVAGYEVWADLIRRDRNYHSKGWHPTSVFGVVGAAASVAVLRRLDAERAATALAIAASYASGLGVNFGTMTKPFHAGMAASNGVSAARLAEGGATASLNALEHPRGFLYAFSPEGSPDLTSESNVGKNWSLPWQRLCVKKYPTCYFMHRSFEAARDLIKANGVTPDGIASAEITTSPGQIAVLVNDQPKTAAEARFSGSFAIAAAAFYGRMGVDVLTDEVVNRSDVQAFFPKVSLKAMDEFDPRDPAHALFDRVRITLQSGEVLDSGPVKAIRGHAEDPLSTEELWAKFAECTAQTHSPADARQLFDLLQKVETLKSAAEIPTVPGLFAD